MKKDKKSKKKEVYGLNDIGQIVKVTKKGLHVSLFKNEEELTNYMIEREMNK